MNLIPPRKNPGSNYYQYSPIVENTVLICYIYKFIMSNLVETGIVIFQGREYDGIDSVPGITPVNKTRNMRFSPPGRNKQIPEIVKTSLDSGEVILSYRGATLIPTNEGEFLGNLAARIASEQADGSSYTVFDIGTGTGILAILLEKGLRGKTGVVVASDISGPALEVAEINFRINGIQNPPELRRRDMLEGLVAEFGRPDLIVSNPPFYTEGRYCGNGFDPDIALNGGADGLNFYNRLFAQSAGVLSDQGLIIAQIQDMNLTRILRSLERFLPGVRAGIVVGPQERICGLVAGSKESVSRYSHQVVF